MIKWLALTDSKKGRHCEEERRSNLTTMGYSECIKIASSNENWLSNDDLAKEYINRLMMLRTYFEFYND